MARSGIYHGSAYETADMKSRRPARGSHPPGAHWYYNNWDFNALGTIYRRRTGEDIFESFGRRIAGPIGMEDYSAAAGRLVFEPVSEHPAYPFELSARDAARFGQLFLQQGRWGGRQVVPEAWVALTTARHSKTNRGDLGYGYLWWTLDPATFGHGAALASGYGGQIVAFVPKHRLVAAQTVDRRANPEGLRLSAFVRLLADVVAAAP
jgi:CubicO group peptidase (beta-lactamase class C family)